MHTGHITFLQKASQYGDLYVSVGSDTNIRKLKNHPTYFSERERVYMINALKYVHEAFISSGVGILDFELDIKRLKPDYFIVNSDGHTDQKEQLCKEHCIEYIVMERTPDVGLPARSSSTTKQELKFPFRIALAGAWIDQPWISERSPGSMVVASIWPTTNFNERSGMATSSRKIARKLWGDKLPEGDPNENAKLLFGAENPPFAKHVSGSQDQLGLLLPGINRLSYSGEFWPEKIDSIVNKDICNWLSNNIHLVPFKPRPDGYNPLIKKTITTKSVKKLASSGDQCWQSILNKDLLGLGQSLTQSLEAWHELLPNTVPPYCWSEIHKYSKYPGATFSGSGGGYVIVASDKEVDGALKIKIRH